ncbi:MAG: uroporphyrin-III C-methyltransferase/precorrin-2 dehydrogenase/sirohydrochlorin ferrochelatase [Thiomicrorhabdus sp.]|nr:MAG: uroporphyrin-III C-methyltransferase/precorrin-2 dehydrogenase/sirohydrochlorin ferrochelatase [Thiomicrorhabdus sp.]
MNNLEQEVIKESKPFQFYIQTIGRGQKRRRSLTQAEAKDAMTLILSGEVTQMQLGAFLMLIRVREETAEEAAGFIEAIRHKMAAPQCEVDLDWGTYAGKRRQLPWFMLALTLLARKGYKVLLHGIVGSESGRLYTEEVAQLLDWPMANSLLDAKNRIEQGGVCYLGVEHFAPDIKTLMGYRDELGLRSPIHSLARMLNPFNARLSVHGVFHKGYDDIHQQAASLLDDQMTAAFCGDGGEAEVRPDRKTEVKMVENSFTGGQKSSEQWSFFMPKTFLTVDPTKKCLDTKVLMAVWQGETQNDYGETCVIQTMTMVLMALENQTYEEANQAAQALWQAR